MLVNRLESVIDFKGVLYRGYLIGKKHRRGGHGREKAQSYANVGILDALRRSVSLHTQMCSGYFNK